MNSRKICVVTAARSEYGACKWLMRELLTRDSVKLQTLVTGSHLSAKFGSTFREIEADGIPITCKIPMDCSSSDSAALVHAMAACTRGCADAFKELRPDILVVMGDRYELLSVCAAAVVMEIPIAHVSGGDITEGLIDDSIRHAVTKLAHLHFPATETAAEIIRQMGEDPARVHVVGEPSLDAFRRIKPIPKAELAARIGLSEGLRWVVVTHHMETLASADTNKKLVDNLFSFLDAMEGIQAILTYPNADPGHEMIVTRIETRQKSNPGKYKLAKSLGQNLYLNLLREAYCMIGNSSSALLEAPSAGLAAITIGARQKGRLRAGNVVSCDGSVASLRNAFARTADKDFRAKLSAMSNPYGDGRTAERLADILCATNLSDIRRKKFHIFRGSRS